MNCFEWQSHSSDYLDGTLIASAKKEAEAHLDSCKECTERSKHYRVLLTAIANQPRSTLPVPIRRSPLTAVLPKLDVGKLGRSRWERVPWYIRTTIEGVSIVMVILLGISAGPKLRSIYERRMERNLSDFNETLSDPATESADPVAAQIPLTRANPANPLATDAQSVGDDYSGENEADDSSDDEDSSTAGQGGKSGSLLHVGSSEIWRFNFKADSPHDIRPKIVQILTSAGLATSTPGIGGVEVPGGIQFDLLVPQNIVANLKPQLEKLAPVRPEGHTDSAVWETFTWYKNKSKTKLPAGQTRIVIWLSQI